MGLLCWKKIFIPLRLFALIFLSVGRLRKNVSKKERFITFLSLPFILLKAFRILIKAKPDLVLGMGGAVSGPVLLAGFLLRKKTILFEPNIVPGLSNRWLAPFVDEIFLVFEEAKKHFETSNIPKEYDPRSRPRTCFLVADTSKYLSPLSSTSGIFKYDRYKYKKVSFPVRPALNGCFSQTTYPPTFKGVDFGGLSRFFFDK